MTTRHPLPTGPRVLLLGLAFLATACASLPPARPASDVAAIAGTWQGWAMLAGANRQITITIAPDGKTDSLIPGMPGPGPRYAGTVSVENGTYRWRSETTGSTGSFVLHEGDGRRVLVSNRDAGGSVELRPVK